MAETATTTPDAAKDDTGAASQVEQAAGGQKAEAEPKDTPQEPDPVAELISEIGEKETETPAAVGAPEQYGEFKVPDGYTLDDTLIGEFKPLAKELNLPQETAQKLVEFSTKLLDKWAADGAKYLADRNAGWVKSLRDDPEIGGAKLSDANKTAVATAKRFGGEQLLADLADADEYKSGVILRPSVVRFLNNVAKATKEGGVITGAGSGKPASNEAEALRRMYPNSPELRFGD
jgi:hypothetical protein